ncbi:MAG: nucleoside-triphosphatase [bacterium]
MSTNITNFLLTGESGVGKTAIILNVLKELDKSVKVGGFVTRAIRSGKAGKGVLLTTLDGRQAVLASLNKKSTYKIGNYGIDVEVMSNLAVPSLTAALETADLIVIDEIGKMECFSKEFRDTVLRCIESPQLVLGTIQAFASPFINTLTNREDVAVIPVDMSNRNDMALNILALIDEWFQSRQKSKPSKKNGSRSRR